MSVSAETYIVISLMFAVFAAVAAVGTSVVLGAGFERLRSGFEVVRKQSGFFADAIYKLDQRTQKLDEEHAKLKGNVTHLGERIERVEKTTTFLADGINSLEQRILAGSPAQQPQAQPVRMVRPVQTPIQTIAQKPKVSSVQTEWVRPQIADRPVANTMMEQARHEAEMMTGLYSDLPANTDDMPSSEPQDFASEIEEPETSQGFTTLLARYFAGESSGGAKGIVYH